ncbi:MAG: hypothetical protein LN413_06915 [Candidatus Thermoplasmatota archaeon]|nr:hypothetical protein [Candidatus Thermoplasmatota archaeon]
MPSFPWLRGIAGVFGGLGAILLIVLGEIPAGVGLLGTMLGFFIGEANGRSRHPSS